MTRASITLDTPADRNKAIEWIKRAPEKTRVVFMGWRRTVPQNDRMHSMLDDVAKQTDWHGQQLSKNDWKLLFLSGLKRESRIVPSLDGDEFVEIGRSSSELSKQEMSDLMELIAAFGAQRNIKFKVFKDV